MLMLFTKKVNELKREKSSNLWTGNSGKSFETLSAKSPNWQMPLVQRYRPEAAGVSKSNNCALATSWTCTAPNQWYSCVSLEPCRSCCKTAQLAFNPRCRIWPRHVAGLIATTSNPLCFAKSQAAFSAKVFETGYHFYHITYITHVSVRWWRCRISSYIWNQFFSY